MINEIFSLLSTLDVTKADGSKKFRVNMNRNHIRSISAYSSNAIFYFPTIVTNQATLEEVMMVSRMIEKSYASFVVACIGLMPFHRIAADDQASIEEYLSQFHQNIGMNAGAGPASKAMIKYLNSDLDESAGVQALQDYLLECWQTSLNENSDFIKVVANEISLNDMFNESAVDPKTKVLQEKFLKVREELNLWGFLGEASDDILDSDMDDLLDMSDEDIVNSIMSDEELDDDDDDDDLDDDDWDDEELLGENTVKGAIDSIRFSLESVSENKIMSCPNLGKLNQLENQLKKLKTKYTKYLNRYKKKYKEAQEKNKGKGGKMSLTIQFNKMTIKNPKAFMKQYGTYIKIINKRLKLVEKRRLELRKRKGLAEDVQADLLTQMDFDALSYCDKVITESLEAPDDEIFTLIEASKTGYNILTVDHQPSVQEERLRDTIGKVDNRNDDLRKQLNYEQRRNASLSKEAQNWKQEADKGSRWKRTYYQGKENFKKTEDQLKKELEEEKKKNRAGGGGGGGKEPPDRPVSGLVPGRSRGGYSHSTFDAKNVFTNMDMQKANEAVPIFTKANIGFIVDDTEEVVTRDVLVGIKAYIHRAPTQELVEDIYNCIINKRKFLKFVKFITGEERSLADLLFGFKELKNDAFDARHKDSGQWRSAFKRRRRWAKMSVPYLTKEYTPNGTVVITMNEVEYIKDQYGIDIMKPDHVRMIMDADFLLGFVVIDQANELVYVTYDGHGYGFQTYTYAMLEREQASSDRMMRELYRSLSR